MSVDAPKTPKSEHSASPDSIAAAFATAKRIGNSVLDDPMFHHMLRSEGVRPRDDASPAYWKLLSAFVHAKLQAHNKNHPHSLWTQVFNLRMATPDFVLANMALKQHVKGDAREKALRTTRSFENSILELARSHPDASAAELEAGLDKTVAWALSPDYDYDFASKRIKDIVRRSQHVLAYGQLLGIAGREFRPARLEEQLDGTDYITTAANGQDLYIRVASSLEPIERQGMFDKTYSAMHNHVLAYSLALDHEFQNHFFLPEQIAKERASETNLLLVKAEQEQSESVLTYSH
ncbi:MAG TPA: hypothetical protein VF261_00080 [Candidatus Saccharimonadales bacterium]